LQAIMAARIEDYALIGDCESAALVARDGSIDWLCLPRFDSPACFAALLGTPEHGRWQIAPQASTIRNVRRRYRPGTLVLETEFETETGAVRLLDCMPQRAETPTVVRVVEGLRGRVAMSADLVLRPDYGSLVPWVRRTPDGLRAVGGASTFYLRTPVALRGEDFHTLADFTVTAGQRVPFTLAWYSSCGPEPGAVEAEAAIEATAR